ncbi:formiminotransferase N-terminal subdomain-containing protein isoform X2 [Brienomyrus brachyistius]|nr:formiminotransferase N-terminal subdomain-containing protein isoform X2 [Brienomyrus brachyistius]XP_048834825.1 formiminotransferase N-terminal subdomain-containing protein isoform X2 [Brienomyrus brachyistius]
MSLSAVTRRMVTCLLNISEARNRDIVDKVARAAVFHKHGGWREGSTVLNIFNDHGYNRSVITIVASIDDIGEAVLSACEQALDMIDMRGHVGAHPCMGAVDLVPLYPLGEDVGLEECGREARELAGRLTRRVPGTAAFYFGMADDPSHRGLAQRRKEVGWFRNNHDLSRVRPDVGGTPESRYGLTGVGASPYVMNCNVTLGTQDLNVGHRVAASLRESSPGGIPGVQVLALPHEGAVEIACNVESVPGAPPADHWPTFSIRGQQFWHAPASLISTHVKQLAGRYGVVTKGTVLVGFTPQECKGLAVQAITQGIGEYWKHQRAIFM